jgi:ABC-type Na+ efflux pump permease subunit
MLVTLPLEVYEALEKGLGKEDARAVVKAIEMVISEATERTWATTKEEILDVIRKELSAIRKDFVTKELFEEKINTLRAELLAEIKDNKAELLAEIKGDKAELLAESKEDKAELLAEFKKDKAELLEKIEALDRKFTVMFLILLFMIIFLNQNALEFIARLLGLIK